MWGVLRGHAQPGGVVPWLGVASTPDHGHVGTGITDSYVGSSSFAVAQNTAACAVTDKKK